MNPWFIAMSAAAFASFIFFINIESAWADKTPARRRAFLWIGIGAGILAVFFLYKVITTSTGSGG